MFALLKICTSKDLFSITVLACSTITFIFKKLSSVKIAILLLQWCYYKLVPCSLLDSLLEIHLSTDFDDDKHKSCASLSLSSTTHIAY